MGKGDLNQIIDGVSRRALTRMVREHAEPLIGEAVAKSTRAYLRTNREWLEQTVTNHLEDLIEESVAKAVETEAKRIARGMTMRPDTIDVPIMRTDRW